MADYFGNDHGGHMSRNLCRTDCRSCVGSHEDIVIEGPVRPVTEKEDPGYYRDHAGLLVAEARCVLCHALYFAWVDWPGGHSFWRRKPGDERRFVDLSYRHAFNDEPAVEDLPVYQVRPVVTYERTPYVAEDPWGTDDEKARYRARCEATLAAKLSVGDERASLDR